MPIHNITHNGKLVLFIDYSKCQNQQEMISLLNEAVSHYRNSPNNIRILSDFTDAYGGIDFMTKLKSYGKELGDKTDKAAVVGVEGVKEILLKGYNMIAKKPTKSFRNKIQALNYLTSVPR